MADRYDLAKDEEKPKETPVTQEMKQSLSKGEVEVWPMAVRLHFCVANSKWRIAVRHTDPSDENQNWHFAGMETGRSQRDYFEFDTRTVAEKWCKEKGLV